ncbi:MAG: hypothetical protein RBS56_02355 [Candidatus Gracilibacteria bacterium]|jgi:hypothetical protein|nr:hypothetical protein [Candidatus Gracilibacteria bacterium]
METPTNTIETSTLEVAEALPTKESKDTIDLFTLLAMGEKIDQILGEGKNSSYEPWKSDF